MLLESLGPCAQYYFVSTSSNKSDLSIVSPRSNGARSKGAFTAQKMLAAEPTRVQQLLAVKHKSLISFLALYITYLDPITRVSTEDVYPWASDQRLRKDVLTAFNDANRTWLRERGYGLSDLAAWRWILSARLSEVAVSRLNALANSRNHGFRAGPVPVFLILFLLRRRHINDRALRMILTLIWDRLLEQDALKTNARSNDGAQVSSNVVPTDLSEHLIFHAGSIMVLVVRLLRRARKVWPAALPSIAVIATRYLAPAKKTNDSLPDRSADLDLRKWSFLFNSILSLLALPSSRQPFQSLAFHERAQFMIVRRMTEFEPALIISRKGYQAVAQVQIAHRKTLPEHEWARQKAKSWPPWRELKSGIDSNTGIEQGVSRGAWAIMRSQEAGYSEHGWDSMAKVFAGWDTDDSPTIQTRAIVPKGDPLWSLPCRSDGSVAVKNDAKLWYARIKATRTVSEAWACFLSYRDAQIQSGNRCAQLPYFSMFEKIIFDRKRKLIGEVGSADTFSESLGDSEHRPLPGDGTETWPDPGPQEAVYLRTRVPSIGSFSKAMIEDGVVPGGRFLEFLLHHAPTLQIADMYLRAGCLPSATRNSLVEGITPAEMCKVDIRIFTAYIHCLCRLPFIRPNLNGVSHRSRPISHALRLMDKREPCYWPPWNFLMMAFRTEGAIVDSSLYAHSPLVQDALAWSVMLCWRQRMKNVGLGMQFECFVSLCIGLAKSTLASQTLLRLLNRGAFVDDGGLEKSTPAGQKLSRLLKCGNFDSVEKSTLASWELIQGLPRDAFRRLANSPGKPSHSRLRNLALLRHNAEQVVANGPEILKAWFEELVGVENPLDRISSSALERNVGTEDIFSVTLMPRLLGVPHPTHLHAFVRVLGLHHDYDGILKIVQWMDRFAEELRRKWVETTNGERAMKKLIAAIRVFLEGSWPLVDSLANDGSVPAMEEYKSAPADTIQQVVDIIKRHEVWGDWPSDEDVEFYVTSDKRHIDYSDACQYFDLSCRDQLEDRPKSFRKRFI